MQLMLGKKHLGKNEFEENEHLLNFEFIFYFLENLRPLTLKSMTKRIDIDFEMVSIVCGLAWDRNRKRLVLLRWLKLCTLLHDSCDIGFSREISCRIHSSASEFFYGMKT